DQLNQLGTSKVCRHCGQELTPGHLETEKQRRERARADAAVAFQEADRARKAAAREERELVSRHKAVENQTFTARDQYQACKGRLRGAEKDVQRHEGECGRAFQEMAEAFRLRVAAAAPEDWLATTYPTAADLEQARGQVQGLAPARQRLQKARAALEQWHKL